MARRSLVALVLAALALGACAAPTAPKPETVDSTRLCGTGAVSNGSHTKC